MIENRAFLTKSLKVTWLEISN